MITISLEPDSHIPMYLQIYEYIKKEILEGRLSYPEKLPSSRSLAAFLQVSRSTVDTAYQQLVAEGYVEPKEKRGFFVNPITHHQSFKTKTAAKNRPLSPSDSSVDVEFLYDFNPNAIDTAHFPYSVWKSIGKNQLDNPDNFLIGNHYGSPDLRQAIADYLHGSRGVFCTPDNIIVGAGLDHLLQMLCVLFKRNAVFAMEEPGYRSARQVILSGGCQVKDIPLKENAMDVSLLEQSGANICYVTPSHQFPLGSIMQIPRRQSLLAWASKKENRYIIEDDHDSEFRYKGKPIPALQSLDSEEKVIYIGTFSKAISPAIRTGYMVLPAHLMAQYERLCGSYACPVSLINQAILTDFIRKGYFEKHLNRMRKIYKSKHDYLIQQLNENFRDGLLDISGDNAGLYVILRYNGKKEEDEIMRKAKEYKICLHSLRGYYAGEIPADYCPSFLIGFANLSENQIHDGIELLAKEVLL